jgi:hypothetical protein
MWKHRVLHLGPPEELLNRRRDCHNDLLGDQEAQTTPDEVVEIARDAAQRLRNFLVRGENLGTGAAEPTSIAH